MKQFCAGVLDDPVYQQSIRDRALSGDLAPAIGSLLWHYRWGKPKEETHVHGTLEVRWQDDGDDV